jgi:hypothetical protein
MSTVWSGLDSVEKFVASATLTEPLLWQNSTLLTGDVTEAIGERRGNEACALSVELPRDRRLSKVASCHSCGNGNDNSTAFPNALHET